MSSTPRTPETLATTRLLPGLAALVGVVAIWSGWVILSRWGLVSTALGPMELMLLRFGFAGVVMGPVLWRLGRGGLRWRDCWALGLTAGPGYAAFTYFGLSLAPAAHGSALTAGMLPLFTMLLGAAVGVTKLTPLRWLGLTLMVSAAGMFFLDGRDPSRQLAWLGDLLLLGGPMMWSIYTLRVRTLGVDALRATAVVSVFALLLYLPVYAAFGHPARLAEAGWLNALGQGVFHGWVVVVGSLTLYTYAVKTLGPASTTLATATVPGVTAAAGVVLLHEPLTAASVAGVALDAAGLVCVALAMRHTARRATAAVTP